MLTYQKKQANLESYRSTEVSTASRLKLLIMLFEGAIRFINQAEEAMRTGEIPTKGVMIGKALAIVNELQSTLDHDQAPEIAANLERLYEFVQERLVRANIENQTQPLIQALRVLKTLHSAWVEVSQKSPAELSAGQPGQPGQSKTNPQNAVNDSSYVRISV